MKFIALALIVFAGCSDPSEPPTDGGTPADSAAPTLTCDEHPELAMIESIVCVVDTDCPVITACVSIVCGSTSTCVFGAPPPNGTPCEAGGACDDRRCCHPVPVTP